MDSSYIAITHFYHDDPIPVFAVICDAIFGILFQSMTVETHKFSQIITNQGVCIQINTKHRPELSSLAKCKVRKKTTPRQFVKNKVRETLSDLG